MYMLSICTTIANCQFFLLQEVQLWNQGESVEVALSKSRALPSTGQCRYHPAALPCHPQHKLPEQGEYS